MTDVTGVGVADDVVGPLVASGVCVAGADVFGLEGFELLEGAEFVGHLEEEMVTEERQNRMRVVLAPSLGLVEELAVKFEMEKFENESATSGWLREWHNLQVFRSCSSSHQ
jgi:hypothetical protein